MSRWNCAPALLLLALLAGCDETESKVPEMPGRQEAAIQTQELPDVEVPELELPSNRMYLKVTCDPGGLSLEILEAEADKLEQKLLREPTVVSVETTIREREIYQLITMNSDVETLEDAAMIAEVNRVGELLDAVRTLDYVDSTVGPGLPERTDQPVWLIWQPGELPAEQVYVLAESIKEKLKSREDVYGVESQGVPLPSLEVEILPAALRQHNLTMDQVGREVWSWGYDLPKQTPPREERLEALKQLPVNDREPPIRLSDLGTVRVYDRLEMPAAWNGRPAVAFPVVSAYEGGYDILRESLNKELGDLQLSPPGEFFIAFPDGTEIQIDGRFPSGSSQTTLEKAARQAARLIQAIPDQKLQVLTLVQPGPEPQVQIYLGGSTADSSRTRLLRELRSVLGTIPGMQVYCTELQNHTEHTLKLRLLGPDLDQLYRQAFETVARLKTLPGVTEIQPPPMSRPVLRFRADARKLKAADLYWQDIGEELQYYRGGPQPDRLSETWVHLAATDPFGPADLQQVFVEGDDDQLIPLTTLGELILVSEPPVLKRRNGVRMVEISLQVHGSIPIEEARRAITRTAEAVGRTFPGEGYRVELAD